MRTGNFNLKIKNINIKKIILKLLFVFIMTLITFNFGCINVSALKSTSSELTGRAVCENIELAMANDDGSITSVSCYDDYATAKTAMDESTDESLIILGIVNGKVEVIDAKYALLYLNHGDVNQNIYSANNLKTAITYMNNDDNYGGVEGAYLGINYSNKASKIKISGVTGWLKKRESSGKANNYYIIPLAWVKSTSYYQVTSTSIKHYYATNIENGGYSQTSRTLGPKPSMLEPGKYYSYDGNYFYTDMKTMLTDYKNGNFDNSVNKDNPYYNYYLYLPHRTRTNYTIDDLDIYLRNVKGFIGTTYGRQYISKSKYSALYGTSEYYMKAEELYGANAISVFGLSVNESGNGRSDLAVKKNNVFGHSAYDGTAYESGTGYMDIRSSIYSHSYSYINYGYSEVSDSRYYGGHFGNKLTGMNVKYASDIYWGDKAASYYYDFDQDNGMLDYNYYQLVISTGSKINARSGPNTGSKAVYSIPYEGIPFVLIEEVEGQEINGSTIWYKLQSDTSITNTGSVIKSNSNMPQYNWEGYVYVHSSYFKKINEASKNEDGTYHKPVDVKKDNIDDTNYTPYVTNNTYTPKVGLLKKDTDYYHTATLLNKKGTLKANSYVTILMESASDTETSYLVITDYGTYQRHWISGKDIEIVSKDLLKVDITDSGKYVNILDKDFTTNIFKVYTGNYLPIVDIALNNDKIYLEVQYKNEGGISYGYVDADLENIDYTLDNIDVPPILVTLESITIFLNEEYNLRDYVACEDVEDGDLTDKVIINHNVDVAKAGTYQVTYSVTDSFGNEESITIPVYVIELEESPSLFMYHELKHQKDDIFTFSGFLGIKGMDNKEISHVLIFENQETLDTYSIELDNWQEYPYEMSSLDDDKAYDYSGGWFKSDVDVSELPNGDYTIYVGAVNGKYVTTTLFTNIAYMDMTRRAIGNSGSYSIEVDYSSAGSPLLFSVRDTLLSTSIPKTFDPMYNFFNEIKLDGSKLIIKGTSHNVGISLAKNDTVKRQIVFEEKETFERYTFDLDSITNGDYPITLAVSDNCDKTRAWYNKTIDISSIPKGNYAIYIVNDAGGSKYHGELIDVAYTDFSGINNTKYNFSRNDDLRLRLELSVKE